MAKKQLQFSTQKRPRAAQIKALYAAAPWAQGRDPRKIMVALKNSPLLASAWDGTRLVGMARCSTDFAFRCVLWDVIVDPAYRETGVGGRMVKMITGHSRLKSVDQFWLYTSANEKFYSTLGFKRETRGVMLRKKKGRR
jgi:ribosomal protein S18 acetylase RimI-like enzyme